MKKGFSLIELSVVIVIIGLLVGVLVAARSIRNTAQIQATISDFGKYKQAAVQYKEKYYYWPGDDPNAGNVWNGASNGDGNGLIDGNVTVCGTSGPLGCLLAESFYAPQDLAKSGFITGTYSGTSGSVVAGVNYIASIMPESSCTFCVPNSSSTTGFIYANDTFSDGTNKNVISLSNVVFTPAYTTSRGGVFDGIYRDSYITPADSYAMDQKIDDGNPNTGYIRGISSSAGGYDNCASSNAANATYAISDNVAACIVDFTLE